MRIDGACATCRAGMVAVALLVATGSAAAEPITADAPVTPSATASSQTTGDTAAAAAPVAVGDEVVALVLAELARSGSGGGSVADRDDRKAIQKFYDRRLASGGIWTGRGEVNAAGRAVIDVMAQAGDWGLAARDFVLPTVAAGAVPGEVAKAELAITVAALKYARHARGGRVDPAELSEYLDRKATLVAPGELLEQLAVSDTPDGVLLKLHPQHPQFERLRQKYLELLRAPARSEPGAKPEPAGKKGRQAPRDETAKGEPSTGVGMRTLLANMEMWRWMPTDLGQAHIFANVPEFQFRYVKDGRVIHSERIITGKPDTQTPIFSERMDHIIFHPTWNVPDSIKVKELLPGLARGSNTIARQGLRATLDGRPIDPQSVDWRAVDIRRLHVYQPSGQANALGLIKFMFPNKHAVYMHDTPSKPLFNSASRAFSHGCVRVRNPARFAEVLLSEDKGWGPDKVKALVDSAPENTEVKLTTRIPVHMAYFTAWVEDDGRLVGYRDVYGYEDRIHLGLAGRASQIVKRKENLGAIRAEVVGRLSEAGPFGGGGGANPLGWIKQIFGN